MPLTAGTRLGSYEIVASLGAGGMGEVYRARDTRLERSVAIKVLPPALAADPQLRERFEREARTISSLNHPHICTLFDVGHQAGVDFLVLEYLEGQTIAERLAHGGRLDTNTALAIAIDLCDALDKAHRAGIVHRDLKPANVMLTKAGAKLLDFGLAKSAAPAVASTALSMLPTTPPNLTAQGTILGTFQYMAPEQIEGVEADARTDIFAFGGLLFEMLTGRTAFEGKTRASLLGAILKDEPPAVSRVQPGTPAALDRIISTCLAKDPDDRYQSARDLRRDLKWVAAGSSAGSSDTAAPPTVTASAGSSRAAWLVTAVLALALVAVSVAALRRGSVVTSAADPMQFTIGPPDNASFGGPSGGGTGSATQVAVSPDGRNIVFVAGTPSAYQIWLRPVAALPASPIPGTEGGTFPFWSPDSRFIGFFAAGKLKKVAIAGGPAIDLCDAPSPRGGSWNRDQVILFAPGGSSMTSETGLQRVSSAGGAPAVVTTAGPVSGSDRHRWPHFLPDGRHFLYTFISGPGPSRTRPSMIRVGSLDPADPATDLIQADSSAIYASGHVLFARDETLMAQPFDAHARQPTGEPFPLAEQISREGSRYVSASVSENGTLVYGRGVSAAGQRLTWFDRAGRVLGTLGEAASYDPALSPEERRVAVALGTGSPGNLDIWIVDIARNVPSRQTSDPGVDLSPVWSPDGARIAFGSRRSGKTSLRHRSIDGTAPDESLVEDGSSDLMILPSDWSADGRFIAYTLSGAFPRRSDVWVLPLFGDRKPVPVAQTGFLEAGGVLSPDGRWIAYTTDEGGQPNVSVQAFLRPGGRHPVSREGGSQPSWRADGKELFYLGLDGTLMAVAIDAIGDFTAGVPQALFQAGAPTFNFATSVMTSGTSQSYAVTKDGQRFLVNAKPAAVAPLTVLLNWPAAAATQR